MNRRLRVKRTTVPRHRQLGGLTVFTAIMILVTLTLMIFYAVRVGLFEQRVSANEVRQKAAFNAAESAIEQGVEYIVANAQLVLSSATEGYADGAGGFTRGGWFAGNRWQECTADLVADADHPCGGDPAMQVGSFYYDDPATTSGIDSLPIGMTGFAGDVTARLSANICFVGLSSTTGGCGVPPSNTDEENSAFMIITLLGYGFSDCTNTANVSTCPGQATIAKPLANFKNLSGAPVVPLTTKTTFPPTGTAEVVPNPNAGGIGVPLSVWANNNDSCSIPAADTSAGSFATCEMHEWYGVDYIPAAIACDQTDCSCTQSEAISWTSGSTPYNGIDIVADPSFPCDLFDYYFNVPDDQYMLIKSTATVLDDCSTLDESSYGIYWINSGEDCVLNANTVLGSAGAPIILISATRTIINGGTKIFGVLYIFDGEDSEATLTSNGSTVVYGAVIVDANMGQYTGTFQVVHSTTVLARAAGLNGLGAISGGWRDFGLPDIAW